MILEEFDSCREAIIDPNMLISKIEDFPEVTISCFSRHLFEKVLSYFEPEKIAELHSSVGISPVYSVEYKGKRFAMYQSWAGEPMCVGMYEELIAMGSKRLILLGNCGVLDKNIEDCGIVIPTNNERVRRGRFRRSATTSGQFNWRVYAYETAKRPI